MTTLTDPHAPTSLAEVGPLVTALARLTGSKRAVIAAAEGAPDGLVNIAPDAGVELVQTTGAEGLATALGGGEGAADAVVVVYAMLGGPLPWDAMADAPAVIVVEPESVLSASDTKAAGGLGMSFAEGRDAVRGHDGLELAFAGLTLSDASFFERHASLYVLSGRGCPESLDLRDLLATGIQNLRLASADGHLAAGGEADPKPRICVVTEEIYGPSRCGGIGTAYTSLVDHLAADGHDLTVLFIGHVISDEPMEHWIEFYGEKGITLVPIDITPMEKGLGWEQEYFRKSWLAYRWLAERDRSGATRFDVVHFPECNGFGYYSMMAKSTGRAFAQSNLCIGTHGSTLWANGSNHLAFESTHNLIQDHAERESIARCDSLIGPSQYLVHWKRGLGWELPADLYQQQYVQPHSARASDQPYDPLDAAPRPLATGLNEVVFFGRLETRKGLLTLCDALDELVDEPAMKGMQVTLLGKDSLVDGEPATDYVKARADNWPWALEMLLDKNQTEAVSYLQGIGRCAVVPSLTDNSPNTVYECIGLGIPFVTARTGGIPELMHAEDVASCTFYHRQEALRGKPLAETLRAAFRDGIRPPRPAVCQIANEIVHSGWHTEQAVQQRAAKPGARELPSLAVCVAAAKAEALDELVDEVLRQRSEALPEDTRLVVSTDRPAAEVAASLRQKLTPPDGMVVDSSERRFFGAVANAALRQTEAEFVIFLAPGQRLAAGALALLADAAAASSADILVPAAHVPYVGDERDELEHGFDPAALDPALQWHFPFGADELLPLVLRPRADLPLVLRRSAFLEAGGFPEDAGCDLPGWEVVLAPALQAGLKVDVVPEVVAAIGSEPVSAGTTSDYYLAQRLFRAYGPDKAGAGSATLAALPSYLRAFEQRFQQTMVKYWDLNWRATEGYEKVQIELEEKDRLLREAQEREDELQQKIQEAKVALKASEGALRAVGAEIGQLDSSSAPAPADTPPAEGEQGDGPVEKVARALRDKLGGN